MKKPVWTPFWVAAVATALFPVVAEALIAANHNETLVRAV
jgi:hypothetical protein